MAAKKSTKKRPPTVPKKPTGPAKGNPFAGIKKGGFHRWLGKPASAPITPADIAKGLASKDPHVRAMAQFAKNAKSFKH